MNIFVLDTNTKKCAEYHNDKHVVKMVLEYSQLLSAAHHLTNSRLADKCYKLTHMNHPCTKWVVESQANYIWLYRLFIDLCNEYTNRYGKVHKTFIKLGELLENVPKLPHKKMTPFAQAMPDYCKDDDPVVAYRNYYIKEKQPLAKWKTVKPDWYEFV